MSNWGDLPRDLLRSIIKNLDLHDHIPFSGVNTNWRFVGIEYRETKIPTNVPGLIIPGGTATSSPIRRFLSMPPLLDKTTTTTTNNNNFINHDLLPPLPIPHLCLCRGSYQGWLALIDNSMNMFLQNPFFRRRFRLPPVTKLPIDGLDRGVVRSNDFSKWVVNKVVLSSNPSSSPDCVVVVFYALSSSGGNIAFCKLVNNGDTNNSTSPPKDWTSLKGPKPWPWDYVDGVFFKDKFYVVDHYGEVYVSGEITTLPVNPTVTHLGTSISPPVRYVNSWYLVEANGELYQILREFDLEMESNEVYVEPEDEDDDIVDDDDDKDDDDESRYHGVDEFDYDNCYLYSKTWKRYRTFMFQVFKLVSNDEGSYDEKWTEVQDLNGAAVFLGYNQSFSLSNPTLMRYDKDVIYYTHDHNGGHRSITIGGSEVIVIRLKDSSVSPLLHYTTSNSLEPTTKTPPIWMTPTSL